MGWLAGCCQWRAPRCRQARTRARLLLTYAHGCGRGRRRVFWPEHKVGKGDKSVIVPAQRDLCEAHVERARACS